MDKKVNVVRTWTDRVRERLTGTVMPGKKNLQNFWRRLTSLFRWSPTDATKVGEDSKNC